MHTIMQPGDEFGATTHAQAGDVVMVVDGGGGTVDVSTYSLTKHCERLVLREIVPPDGGLYGSTLIDQAFE